MTRRHENESLGPAHDPPPYPREWTPEQRLRAYWFVVQHHGTFPTHQSGWYAVLSQAEHRSEHVREVLHSSAEANMHVAVTCYGDS